MNIEKKFLTNLDFCYAASATVIDGKSYALFASETHGPAYMYSLTDYKQSLIWDGPGGTMSMVPVPGKNGDFLAVQNFFPTFDSAEATIVWAHWQENNTWDIKTIMKLPYVHRFDIVTGADGTDYFIGCTLCSSKKEVDDWSDPGKIYVAELPADLLQPMNLRVIKEGMFKNHGYGRVFWQGKMFSMVACENGVSAVIPPAIKGDEWVIKAINDIPTSDVAAIDLDGDGKLELVTIEPFHGNKFIIRHQGENGWEEVYSYPEKMDFGHVVWAGELRGVPTIIGGQRASFLDLFMIQYQDGYYVKTTIDDKTGPSNVAVIHEPERDIIVSANRQIGEAALYIVTD